MPAPVAEGATTTPPSKSSMAPSTTASTTASSATPSPRKKKAGGRRRLPVPGAVLRKRPSNRRLAPGSSATSTPKQQRRLPQPIGATTVLGPEPTPPPPPSTPAPPPASLTLSPVLTSPLALRRLQSSTSHAAEREAVIAGLRQELLDAQAQVQEQHQLVAGLQDELSDLRQLRQADLLALEELQSLDAHDQLAASQSARREQDALELELQTHRSSAGRHASLVGTLEATVAELRQRLAESEARRGSQQEGPSPSHELQEERQQTARLLDQVRELEAHRAADRAAILALEAAGGESTAAEQLRLELERSQREVSSLRDAEQQDREARHRLERSLEELRAARDVAPGDGTPPAEGLQALQERLGREVEDKQALARHLEQLERQNERLLKSSERVERAHGSEAAALSAEAAKAHALVEEMEVRAAEIQARLAQAEQDCDELHDACEKERARADGLQSRIWAEQATVIDAASQLEKLRLAEAEATRLRTALHRAEQDLQRKGAEAKRLKAEHDARLASLRTRLDGAERRSRLASADSEESEASPLPPRLSRSPSPLRAITNTFAAPDASSALLSPMVLRAGPRSARRSKACAATTSTGGDAMAAAATRPTQASDPGGDLASRAAEMEETLFVLGGDCVAGTSVASYHAGSGSWVSGAPLAQPRFGAAAVGVGSRVWVAGGTGESGQAVECYDSLEDQSHELADLPYPVSYAAACADPEGRIHLTGGISPTFGGACTQMHVVLRPTAQDAKTGPGAGPPAVSVDVCNTMALSVPRQRHQSCVVHGRVLVLGGCNDDLEPVTQIEAFDLQTERWGEAGYLRRGRHSFGLAVLAGKLYLIGGVDSRGAALASVEVYDPVARSWADGVSLPRPRHSMATAVHRGRVCVLGGEVDAESAAAAGDDDQQAGDLLAADAILTLVPEEGGWRVGDSTTFLTPEVAAERPKPRPALFSTLGLRTSACAVSVRTVPPKPCGQALELVSASESKFGSLVMPSGAKTLFEAIAACPAVEGLHVDKLGDSGLPPLRIRLLSQWLCDHAFVYLTGDGCHYHATLA